MRYKAIPDSTFDNDWSVIQVDNTTNESVTSVFFSGPEAQRFATEYAEWKNRTEQDDEVDVITALRTLVDEIDKSQNDLIRTNAELRDRIDKLEQRASATQGTVTAPISGIQKQVREWIQEIQYIFNDLLPDSLTGEMKNNLYAMIWQIEKSTLSEQLQKELCELATEAIRLRAEPAGAAHLRRMRAKLEEFLKGES